MGEQGMRSRGQGGDRSGTGGYAEGGHEASSGAPAFHGPATRAAFEFLTGVREIATDQVVLGLHRNLYIADWVYLVLEAKRAGAHLGVNVDVGLRRRSLKEIVQDPAFDWGPLADRVPWRSNGSASARHAPARAEPAVTAAPSAPSSSHFASRRLVEDYDRLVPKLRQLEWLGHDVEPAALIDSARADLFCADGSLSVPVLRDPILFHRLEPLWRNEPHEPGYEELLLVAFGRLLVWHRDRYLGLDEATTAEQYNHRNQGAALHFDMLTERVCSTKGQLEVYRVRLWQAQRGLLPDGKVGPKTLMAALREGSPAAFREDAGAAVHDGDAKHPLGRGDEVFDQDGRVVAAFPATAEGVVAAAFYELHRGSTKPLAWLLNHDGVAKATRSVAAAHEGPKRNRDGPGSQTIGHLQKSGPVGPIAAYQSAGDAGAGAPWCGCFATFVYLRAGIVIDSLAFSLNVPNVLARRKEGVSSYYGVTGAEETEHHRHLYRGVVMKGEASDRTQSYHESPISLALDLDIRAGDCFWLEHQTKRPSGHVGIVVGVHKTKERVIIVTIEGNTSNRVDARTYELIVDDAGNVTSPFKGWGRPAELNTGPANSETPREPLEKPAWISALETDRRRRGSRNEPSDR